MAGFMSVLNKVSSFMNTLDNLLGGDTAVDITLSCDGTSVSFPILPAEFRVANPYNTTSVNINNLGDINMKGKRGLASLTIESFFPAEAQSYLVGGGLVSGQDIDPYGNVAKIKQMAISDKPSRINISSTDVSMPVLIKSFEYGETDGSGDVYFSISLEEYRFISQESSNTNGVTGLKERSTGATEKTATVAKGMDTMDAVHKAVHNTNKNISIAKQGMRKLTAVKAAVKYGGLPAGTVIRSTSSGMSAGKFDCRF
nr:MAG TPA: tail assembly protein [Caudoviricetes sp.]